MESMHLEDDNKFEVHAYFYFSSKADMNFDEATKVIGIKPTKTRTKDTFRISEYAANEWTYETGYQDSRDIQNQLDQLMAALNGKEQEIATISNRYSAATGFNIVVRSINDVLPGMALSREFVAFAGQIGAQIQFDIYCCLGEYF